MYVLNKKDTAAKNLIKKYFALCYKPHYKAKIVERDRLCYFKLTHTRINQPLI